MAYHLSQGKWLPYPYLVVLSRWLADAALGKRRRIIVSMPPRHGKSELISRWFPLWYLNNWPDRRVALCSYGAELAEEHGGWVRDAVTTHRASLKVRLSRSQTAAHKWKTSEYPGGMASVGVGGGLTGKGYNIGIIDDPVKNRKDADSATLRKELKEWYTSTFWTRGEPDAAIIILMTRWHEADLVGMLLEEAANGGEQWDVLCLPAIAEEGDQLGRPVGAALCPWRYNETVMAAARIAVGPRDWASLFQQRPAAESGDIFLRDWFTRHWDALPYMPDQWIQSWDMAFKDTDGSDYVVGECWCSQGANRYLVDQVRDRMSFTSTVAAVRTFSIKWPDTGAKLVEDKANGPAVISTLQDEIPGLIAVNPEGGKETRAHAVTPYYSAGNIWHPPLSQSPWYHDYVEELVAFPHGRNDDQVDATTQALIYLQANGGMVVGGTLGELVNWSKQLG